MEKSPEYTTIMEKSPETSPEYTTIMLRNLSPDIDINHLLVILLDSNIKIDYIHVCKNFATKECIGIAYINFINSNDILKFKRLITNLSYKINIAFAKKQGFEECVKKSYREHVKDESLKPWVTPEKEYLREYIEYTINYNKVFKKQLENLNKLIIKLLEEYITQ
jgi:hypothetical protein